MSKIILKNVETIATPTEGQVVLYAQGGSLKTWSHEGSPSSLGGTFTVPFVGALYIGGFSPFDDGGGPEYPAEYYLEGKDTTPAYPLSSDAVITAVAVYSQAKSQNVPLSVRAYRGDSEEEPVDAGELVELPASLIVPRRGGGSFGGTVTTATGLNIPIAAGGYLTVAFQPVTDEPGDVMVNSYMTVVMTLSPA